MRRIVDPYGLLTGEINRCITGFMPLAKLVAGYYASRSHLDYDDLYSRALQSIAAAHESFDPAYEHNAYLWVRQKMLSDLSGIVDADYKKRQARRDAGFSVMSLEDIWLPNPGDNFSYDDIIPSDEPTPEDNALDNETQSIVLDTLADAMNELSPKEREIITATYITNPNMQQEDVANMLGCSIFVLRKHITKARRKMRAYFIDTDIGDLFDDRPAPTGSRASAHYA